MSHNVTHRSRGAPILGVSLRVALQSSTLHRLGVALSARRGRRNICFCPVYDGSCSRGPPSDPLRRVGGPAGFPGASRPPHHLTRIPRIPTPANSHLMHNPHQERVGRERLSLEALGVGSLAFRDMPLPVEYGGSNKPLVLLCPFLLGEYISECHRFHLPSSFRCRVKQCLRSRLKPSRCSCTIIMPKLSRP